VGTAQKHTLIYFLQQHNLITATIRII
jgi:hypothetical protein